MSSATASSLIAASASLGSNTDTTSGVRRRTNNKVSHSNNMSAQYEPQGDDEQFAVDGSVHKRGFGWKDHCVKVVLFVGIASMVALISIVAIELKNRVVPPEMDLFAVGFRNGDLYRKLFDSSLTVTDDIPEHLIGKTLYRNGPGYYFPGMEHWFFGLAFLNSWRFESTNRVTYSSQFVRSASFPNSTAGPYSPNSLVTIRRVGNHTITNTASINSNEFDPRTLETIAAPFNFHDSIPDGRISPEHGAYDPQGNFFNFFTSEMAPGIEQYYQFYMIKAGTTERILMTNRTMPSFEGQVVYIHEFSATEQFLILVESPAFWSTQPGPDFWRTFTWKPSLGTKIRLIDRVTGLDHAIFNAPAFYAFHHVNAWHTAANTIKLDVISYPGIDVLPASYLSSILNKTSTFTADTIRAARLTRYELPVPVTTTVAATATADDILRADVKGTVLSDKTIELPSINRRYHGREYKYVYGNSMCSDSSVFLDCLIKLDVSTTPATSKTWKSYRSWAGEPLFMASLGNATLIAEDAGSIVSVVLDGPDAYSYLAIINADSFETQSKVKLPAGEVVPIGFHGAVYTSLP